MKPVKVPFFRPQLTDDELQEVLETLRSGWLTTRPQVRRFEAEFAEAIGAPHTPSRSTRALQPFISPSRRSGFGRASSSWCLR